MLCALVFSLHLLNCGPYELDSGNLVGKLFKIQLENLRWENDVKLKINCDEVF